MNAAQCRMARAALQLKVEDLAERTGLSRMTIARFESGQSRANRATVIALRQAFEAAGVEFLDGGAVRLREAGPVEGVAQ